MSGEEDKDRPEEPKTVFAPGGAGVPKDPAPTEPSPASDWGAPPEAKGEPEPKREDPGETPGPRPTAPPGYATMAPRAGGSAIQVGDVLNHIFEVKRFIARGGMGEVFEGVNVSSDERVAIKVMLPSLAADPNVQAMFRKEALTLTRLGHPALVQYRVLAQEPQLGALYIVTEYIDGTNLSNELRTLKPSEPDLRALARRLAEGLRAAHALDAIHRDISPDNILLPGGRLDQAKIIDFGIAKNLGHSDKTIVGDGFAGKLNYVAPEQLGDFGREIGPWTDVYSLGLVILAISQGRDVDMGATLVDAVDRRRTGPDLNAIAEPLRGVIARMLVPDPAKRLRSMDAVIEALDEAARGPSAIASKPAAKPKVPGGKAKGAAGLDQIKQLGRRHGLLVAGGAALLAVLITLAILFSGSPRTPAPDTNQQAEQPPVRAPAEPLDQRAAAAIDRALSAMPCAWLELSELSVEGNQVRASILGAASNSAEAQGAVARSLSSAGIGAASIDTESVFAATPEMCPVLDAFGPIQAPPDPAFSARQRKFELSKGKDGALAADAIIEIDVGRPGQDMAMLGLEPNGKVELLPTLGVGRGKFLALAGDPNNAKFITKIGDHHYRLTIATTHEGLSGLLVITASSPISPADAALLSTPPGSRTAQWPADIAAAAARGGWQAQMIWYRTTDDIPG